MASFASKFLQSAACFNATMLAKFDNFENCDCSYFMWRKFKTSPNFCVVVIFLKFDKMVTINFAAWPCNTIVLGPIQLDCPLSKGNQVPHLKFERSNGKSQNPNFFLPWSRNWCVQLTWKLNEAISLKIWLESKQIKTNQWGFFRFTS